MKQTIKNILKKYWILIIVEFILIGLNTYILTVPSKILGKIIDLLNKIANGETKEEIMFQYNNGYEEYANINTLFDRYTIDEENLNTEIEIIEEDKKIERLQWCNVKGDSTKAKLLELKVNAILQFMMQMLQFVVNPIDWLSRGFNFYLMLCWIALGLGSGTEIIHYYAWYKKAKRLAEEEEYLHLPKSIKGFRITYLIFAMVSLFLGVLALMDFTSAKYGWFIVVWTTVVIGVPLGGSRLLKKMKVSAKWNQIIIIVLAIVASVGMTTALIMTVMKDADFISRAKTEMPLEITDLREVEEDNLVEDYRESGSIFLTYKEGYQREKWEEGEGVEERLMIDYTVLVIKLPFIYGFCKEEMLDRYSDWDEKYPELQGYQGYKKVNVPQWNAMEVYQYHGYENEPENKYIVCYEDRILQIDFGWEITDEDIAKVRESIYNIP